MGWLFGNKKTSVVEAQLLSGACDYHSHILPGVDDGIQHIEDSLEALEFLESVGIRELWLTPHIMEDYPNTPHELQEKFNELKEAYQGGIKLNLASENMLDSLFEQRLEQNNLLPLYLPDNSQALLVETSYFAPPSNLIGLIKRIKSKGYHVILAHPERYTYMEKKDYDQLKDEGVMFQLNYPALAGAYGVEAKNKTHYLIGKGYYNCFGCDLHRLARYREAINLPTVPKADFKVLENLKTITR